MTKRVITHFEIPGLFVQIEENHWDGKPRTFHYPKHTVFCWRQSPDNLPLDAEYGPRKVTHGGRISVVPADLAIQVRFAGRHRTALLGLEQDRLDSQNLLPVRVLLERIWDCADVRDTTLEYYLRQIAIEVKHPGQETPELVSALANAAVLTFSRYLRGGVRPIDEPSLIDLDAIRNHIETNLSACNVGELAALCGLSARHFGRLFKEVTGKTVHSFVLGVKLDMARKLLVETDHSVKDIAYQLGFAHSSTFTTAFRRHTNHSPVTLRSRRPPVPSRSH